MERQGSGKNCTKERRKQEGCYDSEEPMQSSSDYPNARPPSEYKEQSKGFPEERLRVRAASYIRCQMKYLPTSTQAQHVRCRSEEMMCYFDTLKKDPFSSEEQLK